MLSYVLRPLKGATEQERFASRIAAAKMKRIAQVLKAHENRIYLCLFFVALLVSAAFWSGQYIYAFHLEGSKASFQQWMGFTGLLSTGLLLGGMGCIGFFIRSQGKRVRRKYHSKMKQMASAHDMELLAQNAGEMILLLDQPRESSPETNTGIEPLRVSPNPGLLSGRSKTDLLQLTKTPDALFSERGTKVEDLVEVGSPFPEKEVHPTENGNILEAEGQKAYLSMIQDIENTERKLNETERNKAKGRYRIVSEFASDWNYWQGLDKEMLYVSPSCQDITGYPSEEFFKAPGLLDAIIHPEDQSLWASHNQEELAEKNPVPLEFRIQTPEGEVRWVSHFCKPVHDHQNGKFLGVCGSNRDITTQKRAEEEVRVKTEELLRSNAELEQFAYVASHDLQTPLRAISGYLNLLTKRYQGKLEGDADRFIQRTHENVLRMQRLIQDLLTFSRLTTRARPFEPTDLNQVLREVLEMLQPAIEEYGAKITPQPLPTILADYSQFLQLFQNLIGNALKFRDNRPPEVLIDARKVERAWLFSVKDNGIGIDPQYAERIFLIFQRLHSVDQYPGTGIGLAICKKIVERHGGRIWVESKAGEGANFKFLIPDSGGHRS
jgi:PAS domain S-box-containing protein